MPNYEFRCNECKKTFEIFLRYDEYGVKKVFCPNCNGENIQRKINKVRIGFSEDSRLEKIADPNALESLEEDPKALGKMMRQMSQQLGEDMGPEFHEVVHRLEAGQSPNEIESAIPDLQSSQSGESSSLESGLF